MKLGEDKFGLQQVWDGVFNVYKEFAKICEEHKLRYYVSDGCALGAVRHGGFIPWDDDLDVSMPRADYEEFLLIAESKLPPHLKIVTWRNTSQYNALFAKIQDSREQFVREVEQKIGITLSNGIFIDILPIDGAAKSSVMRFIADRWFRLRRVLMRFKCDNFSRQTRKGKMYWLTGMFLYPFFPWLWRRKALLLSYENSAKKYSFDNSEFTIRMCSNVSYRRKPIKRSVWGSPTEVPFGETVVKLPERAQLYLTAEYGDFMQLPPTDKQKPSHVDTWRSPWWLGTITDNAVYKY